MKKTYVSPTLESLSLLTTEAILKTSEEAFDIEVSFDDLWGVGM